MTRPAALILAGLLAPTPSFAQSTLLLHVAPQAERVSVEHIKKVTIGGGSSSSASSASGLALSANLRVGAQRELPGKWLLGVEVEGIVSAQRVIEGRIHPTPNGNVHDVWPGTWDYSDRYGTGFSVLVGRRFGNSGSRGYVFGGPQRMWTEFATGGVNPANGEAGEDRDIFARTPWSVGIGALLRREWPIDVRVRYSRSSLDWIISQDSLRLDYRYNTSALSISVGVGISS